MGDRLNEANRRAIERLLADLPRLDPYHATDGLDRIVAEIESVLADHRTPTAPQTAHAMLRESANTERAVGEIAALAAPLAQSITALDQPMRGRLETRSPGSLARLDDLQQLARWATEETRRPAAEPHANSSHTPRNTPGQLDEQLIETLHGLWIRVTTHTVRRDPASDQPFSRFVALCAQAAGIEADSAQYLRVRVFDRTELSESAALLASIPELD